MERRRGDKASGPVGRPAGFAYVVVLLLVTVLTVAGLSILSKSAILTFATLDRGEAVSAEYLAEAAANHAVWLLLHDPSFPVEEDRYYMHSLGAGRYGYMARRHSGSTFATIAALGAAGEAVVRRSYVVHIKPPAAGSMITGVYTGDGSDDRAITGVGFQPDVVIVKSERNYRALIRTSTIAGDAAKPMEGRKALESNLIQSLDPDGFTVGSDNYVNGSGYRYYWAAFRAVPGRMGLGTYIGDGSYGRSVSGLPFSPHLVFVFSEDRREAVHKCSGTGLSFVFGRGWPSLDCVLDPMSPDGFRVGSNERVNKAGERYHYVCWPQIAGRQVFAAYTGDGSDDRNLQGFGLGPEYMIVQSLSWPRNAVHRTASISGDQTLYFRPSWSSSNLIQAFLPDGAQMGRDWDVNRSGWDYAYYVWARD